MTTSNFSSIFFVEIYDDAVFHWQTCVLLIISLATFLAEIQKRTHGDIIISPSPRFEIVWLFENCADYDTLQNHSLVGDQHAQNAMLDDIVAEDYRRNYESGGYDGFD